MENKLKTPVQQYEEETGKSIWRIKNMYHTDEYVTWLKNWLKTDEGPASTAFKQFAKSINDGK